MGAAEKDDDTSYAIPIVIVGHVDHGKSTLVARLVHDSGGFPDGKLAELRAVSSRRGATFEWSFLLDALQLERDQAITVDSTQIRFKLGRRRYIAIDAPGHHEFVRNMMTGAAQAHGAILVVDAVQGIAEQTRRHAALLKFLGVRQIVAAINKMDLAGFSEHVFERLTGELRACCQALSLDLLVAVPISARDGDGLIDLSPRMPWYRGPTLGLALEAIKAPATAVDRPFRFPVQAVYRVGDERIAVGRLESGHLAVGDRVLIQPTNRFARIAQFYEWGRSPTKTRAEAGESIAVRFDSDVFVERGHVIADPASPPDTANVFHAKVVWLGESALKPGSALRMKLATAEYPVVVESIDRQFDFDTLTETHPGTVGRNAVAEVRLRTRGAISFDPAADQAVLGRAMLVDGHRVVAACLLVSGTRALVASRNLTAVVQSVSTDERAARNGYKGAVLWFTGLSGSGKSTLAMALQRELFERGIGVYVLDGDNLRAGLNRDLGFHEADRIEHLRRVAEVAKLFADAGFIVISAFIAPTDAVRRSARTIVGAAFQEIYLDATLAACEARDPKGLYAKARRGEIEAFTGISSVWEPPQTPDLRLDTGTCGVTESLATLIDFVERRVLIPPR